MGSDADRTTVEAPGVGQAEFPTGPAAGELPACDLVMKGGVTSGIVYPGVVQELARRYRFARIGGTSAGAIAAAVCAAAELARQRGGPGGIAELDRAVKDLRQKGFLLGLFQPTPAVRPLFDALTTSLGAKMSVRKRVSATLTVAWRKRPWIALLAIVLVAGLVALAIAAFSAFPVVLAVALTVLVVAPVALVVAVATALVALGLLVGHTVVALKDSDYGMCPGSQQPGCTETAMIDWLHEQIQRCAGRTTTDPPLTFRDLEDEGIQLTMLSTDLSLARPIRVPDDLTGYLFDPGELRTRFPQSVVDAMLTKEARDDADNAHRSQPMPTEHLPVLVGVRLSLSFPLLLSAMPLYLPHPATKPPSDPRHLFSDGGISSNFPVHFFDAWFPGRPTFGIDLTRHPDDEKDSVFMPSDPTQPSAPRLRPVGSVVAFLANIIDTMQNWRDSLQSELPGFRDRMCQIRLASGEGGLSLNMDPELIDHMVALGHEAGERILTTFDAHQWDQHRWVRYLTLMQLLQGNLHNTSPPFAAFAPALEAGLPDVTVYREGRDGAWCERARAATDQLVALGGAWGPPPLGVDFGGAGGPRPVPVMRVVPRA
jgi:patatin-like phospholipase